jgi:hypothetical protein
VKETQWTLCTQMACLTKSRADGLQIRTKMVTNYSKVTSLQIRRNALLNKSSGRNVIPTLLTTTEA